MNGDANVVLENNFQEHVEEEDGHQEEEEPEYDELWTNQAMRTIYSDDLNHEDMYNPINPFGPRRDGKKLLKRKAWMDAVEGNKLLFNRRKKGESSGQDRSKRRRDDCSAPVTSEASAAADEDNTVRGAVDPEPPKPP